MPAARTVPALMLASLAPLVAGAESDATPAAAQCVSIEDSAARLACYDRAFGRSSETGAAAPAIAEGTAAAVSTDAARAVDEFGLSDAAKRKRDPEKAKETMPESISSTVTRVAFRPTGEVVVTLENEQVWEQAEIVTTKPRVKVGDAVTIRKAALGSYTLLTPGRTVIRVRRVR